MKAETAETPGVIDVDVAIDERRIPLLRLLMSTALLMISLVVIFRFPILATDQRRVLYFAGALTLLFAILLIFRQIPYLVQAVVVCGLFLTLTIFNLAVSGITSIGIFSMMVATLLSFAFLGVRRGTIAAAVAALAIATVGVLTAIGQLQPAASAYQFVGSDWFGIVLRYLFFATIIYVMSVNLLQVIIQALNDQHDLTERLSADRSSLLARVEESTKALTLTADISRQLTTIIDTEPLLDSIVGQIQSMFGYYHVQIYLVDPETNMLVLRGASGQGRYDATAISGRRTIPYDIGVVGLAASRKESILIRDISETNIWIPSPDLPKTQAEIAVPIILDQEVIGVLNVHHHVYQGLDESDLVTLEAVTLQLATALTNARLFENAFRQANHQARISHITQRLEAATDVYALVQMAAREISQAVGVQTKIQLNLKALQERAGIRELTES